MLWLIHKVIWEQNVFLSHPPVSPQKCGMYICELPTAIWDTGPFIAYSRMLFLFTYSLSSSHPAPDGGLLFTATPDLLALCLGIDHIKLKY